ncbi:hypothetical protein HCN44_002443 [Aphidius gifuensis]|uniref:Uncharacterized protein n=1 Tax=Aphidius gifuensis TaxID=684658 RepID=A0A835CUU0_APHGI|nr:hypothetical protein HCN44_002443 [Aphidius gifuensis]
MVHVKDNCYKNSSMNDMEKLRYLINEINCLKCPRVEERRCCMTILPPRVIELPSVPQEPPKFECPRPTKPVMLTSIPRPCCISKCPGFYC